MHCHYYMPDRALQEMHHLDKLPDKLLICRPASTLDAFMVQITSNLRFVTILRSIRICLSTSPTWAQHQHFTPEILA
jgi:hypothetical protein